MIRLNLGSGNDYMEGWINIDQYAPHKVDARFDIIKLPYDNNTVDEIKAFHVIEHFPWSKGNEALREWYRVLKPQGRLWLETPDFLASCREYVNGDNNVRNILNGHFFSEAGDTPGQLHYLLFSEEQLAMQLGWAGFHSIKRIEPSSGYSKSLPTRLFLCVEAFK
jgi:SAM-dependent methyltransferase